jgi:hypothetical protein
LVLSDRAQIFLCAAIKFWNNEEMKDFLARAYRIVNGRSSNEDLNLTNIHACIAHVLIVSLCVVFNLMYLYFFTQDARRTINKFIIKDYRELAMWSVALLVNTCTWEEFKCSWKLICNVFLQLHYGDEKQPINQEYQDLLLNKIQKIKSDLDTCIAVQRSDSLEDDNNQAVLHDSYNYEFDDDDNEEDPDDLKSNNTYSKSRKRRVRNSFTAKISF